MHLDYEGIAAVIRETAANEIMPRFRRLAEREVMEKRPGDVVTVADIAAEQRLQRDLSAILPGSQVIGEEAMHHDPGLLERFDGDGPLWIVDPVDGTANFVAGRTPFVVQVALLMRGETVAAWIFDPVADVMRVAERGGGAWRNGTRMQVAAAAPVADMVGMINLRALGDVHRDHVHGRLKRFGEISTYRCAGHDFSMLAEGKKHFSLYRRLWSWDHAPGVLLHREAGGYCARADGVPYRALDRVRSLLCAPSAEAWQGLLDFLSLPGHRIEVSDPR